MKLTLDNYQSHPHTEIEIRPGVTAIVGSGDIGKSSIIRAWRDLMYGPRGSANVSWWAKEFSVSMGFDEHYVTLEKGAKKNRYLSQSYEDPAPIEWSGHGKGVPKDLERSLGVWRLDVDQGISLRPNLAEQDDPAFLLYENGAVIAKILGSISGLHIIFSALREAQTQVTQANASTKALEAKVSATRASLVEQEATVARLSPVKAHIDLLVDARGIKLREASKAREIRTKMNEVASRVKEHRNRAAPLGGIGDLYQGLSDLKDNIEDATKFGHAIADVRRSMGALAIARKAKEAAKAIDLSVPLETLAKLQEKIVRLQGAQRIIETSWDRRRAAVVAKDTSDYEFLRAQEDLAEIKTCPLCNQAI